MKLCVENGLEEREKEVDENNLHLLFFIAGHNLQKKGKIRYASGEVWYVNVSWLSSKSNPAYIISMNT